MSEHFDTDRNPRTLTTPRAGSLWLQGDSLDWQASGSDGFWMKTLYQDAGQRTCLMKVDPGASVPLHAHDELEQIYVLQGTFFDQEHEYAAGDYVVRAPGAPHSAGSADGALVLLVYST